MSDENELLAALQGRKGGEVIRPNFGGDWSAPDLSLLGSGRRSPPTFPLSCLGSTWAEWCERRADGASAPVDYVATALLAATGALLANVRWPVAYDWSEPPILWVAEVGGPGSGKSPSLDSVTALLRYVEEKMRPAFDEELRQHEGLKQAAEAYREIWQGQCKAAAKDGIAPPPLPPGADIPNPPQFPRIRVQDATTEKLAVLAGALPRGLLLYRDELSGWIGGFDSYSSGGRDRPFFIEAYGGRSYSVDRMRSPETLTVRHLSIGVLGTTQPDKLADLFRGADDGFTSRFLWTWPEPVKGFKLARSPLCDGRARAAFDRLHGLAMGSDEYGNPIPKRLPLEPDAIAILEAFTRDVRERANEAEGLYASALGKASGHVLRLSCCLAHLWWTGEDTGPEPDRIEGAHVAAAAQLVADYFLPMTVRVLGDASIPATDRAATTLAREIKRRALRTFNARELRRKIGGDLREPKAMDGACDALIDAGWLRYSGGRAGATAGRASKTFDVNPAIWMQQ